MATELTKKEKGFVKDYLETGNGTHSALNNYDTDDINTAASIASENLRKAKVHVEGLNATKRSGTGGMKIGIGTDGKVNDMGHTEIDEPDYSVRHKYLDSAYKLKGSYAAEKKEIELSGTVNTQDPKAIAIAQKYEQEIKQQL